MRLWVPEHLLGVASVVLFITHPSDKEGALRRYQYYKERKSV